jgi:NAD-dependent deacetylase
MKNKILIFSGAGLSAESGISTFRDSGGLWENHKILDVCTFSTWEKNYNLVHNFYNQRRIQLANVVPNEAHNIIAKIQEEFDNVVIISQNVDDLLEASGCIDVCHVHGFLTEVKCTNCNEIIDIGYTKIDDEYICSICNCTKVKPNIIFFGESAPEYLNMYDEFNSLQDGDTVIVIGTDGSVVPIDNILKRIKSKVTKILVNLNHSEYINTKNFKYVYKENASTGMVKVYELLKEKYKE